MPGRRTLTALLATAALLAASLAVGAAAPAGAADPPAATPVRSPAAPSAGAPPAAGPGFHAGASGAGDPYYPQAGNGGYDVVHYDLAVRYNPASDRLVGRATVVARATESLSSFDLDLVGLTVDKVTVSDRAATWTRAGPELVVTPRAGIVAGSTFTTVVWYSGVPISYGPGGGGFVATDDGAIVAGEPTSASLWFPVNDHPSDKASYTFRVTVPDDLDVIANGLPAGTSPAAKGWSTHVWDAPDPMAPYLATVDIGHWRVTDHLDVRGRRVIDAVDPDLVALTAPSLAREPEIIAFLEGLFGRYPFRTYGAIVDDYPLFFALETQTRPVYSPFAFSSPQQGATLLVHELAHQWFGDSVSVAQWRDTWLNEGFATYAEWLWSERTGGPSAAVRADAAYAAVPRDDPFWSLVVSDPGANHEFDDAVYDRGGMALQALRTRVGDAAFFAILRTWVAGHAGRNGSIAEFVATAESVSGMRLDALFRRWLSLPTRPPHPPAPAAAGAAAAAAAGHAAGDVAGDAVDPAAGSARSGGTGSRIGPRPVTP